MIIQSLVRYYDILAADGSTNVSKLGFSPAKVSFAFIISDEGNLTNIVDLRSDAKKKVPKLMKVPLQKSRSGKNPPPYFLCDKPEFVLGIEKMKKKEFEDKVGGEKERPTILADNGKEVFLCSEHSISYFIAFRDFHHLLLDRIEEPTVRAFLKFLDGWKPEKSFDHPKIKEYYDVIFGGGSIVFEISGKYLHENSVAVGSWERHSESETSEESYIAQCLVTGDKGAIAKTHQKIKGVYDPGGKIPEKSLISFNEDSFCSYGKEQSLNAPVNKSAMFKYTTALNHLLEQGSRNRIQIGDTSTVFWAETTKRSCNNLVRFLIDPVEDEEKDVESPTGASRKDEATRQLVSDILGKVRSGEYLQEKDLGVDPETTKFYILGLSPNNARLAVRFWHEDSFGNFIERIARHHLDMEIERDERAARLTSMYWLLKQTIPEESKDLAASPMLGGLLMRAILENTPYPVPLYNAILNRVKVERSINAIRAGFIKACLIRLARARGNHEEDMITVSLNEESQNVPYRLGRLFAVLEKAQNDSNKDLKSTINSKYFSSASTTPAVVFPGLLKLSQHHIAKSEWGFKSDQAIQEIMNGINGFPKTLTLEEQGMFMIGYYHQRKANYRKKADSEEKTKSLKED